MTDETQSKLISTYGEFTENEIMDSDISESIKEYLIDHLTASKLFFTFEVAIDIEDLTREQQKALFILGIHTAGIELDAKIMAIHTLDKYAVPGSIQTIDDDYEFTSDGNVVQYLIFTDEEANDETERHISNSLEDVGPIELLGDTLAEELFQAEGVIDAKWFIDYMLEDNIAYAEEIMNENENDAPEFNEVINRLHEEMIELNVMPTPEWPEEPEDKDSDEWNDWKETYDEMYQSIKDEVQNKIEDFAIEKGKQYDSAIEWYIDNFGEESFNHVIVDNDLLDIKAGAKWLLSNDKTDRGNELASWDGRERQISVDFEGETYDFYFYRTN